LEVRFRLKQLIKYEMSDGQPVVFEVSEEQTGITFASNPGEIVGKAADTLESALDNVKPAVLAVVDKFRQFAGHPDAITIEFGIDLTLKAGAIVAAAAAEGHFKVSVSWNGS